MPYRGQCYYKKSLGLIEINDEVSPAKITWTGNNIVKHFSMATIEHLQATKPGAEKAAVKLTFTNEKVLFGFKTKQVMSEVVNFVQRVIARKKSGAQNSASQNQHEGDSTNDRDKIGHPNQMPGQNQQNKLEIQNKGTNKNESLQSHDEQVDTSMNDDELLKNLNLQQNLLKLDSKLMKLFTDAVIKQGMDTKDFWSCRVQLLRSFALQNHQRRGPYNVLSTIKPVASSDNQVNVNVTRDKIREIFKQYPLVRKAYDDLVPKMMSEGEFWSRFFSSKLFRTLRGEKINNGDRGDATIDKYLQFDLDYDGEEIDEEMGLLLDEDRKRTNDDADSEMIGGAAKKKIKLFHDQTHEVSKCLDLEGNKNDDPELRGNTPDITMKKNSDKSMINILRSMNRLSRRMLMENSSGDKNNDTNSNSHLDDEFKRELEFEDLDETQEVEYNELNYEQRSNVAASIIPDELIKSVTNHSPLNPTVSCEYDLIIEKLKKNFKTEFDLTETYRDKKRQIYDAYKDVNNLLKQNSKSSQALKNSSTIEIIENDQDEDLSKTTLSSEMLNSLKLTHMTCQEFLHQFWNKFNTISTSNPSSNPNFKSDLIKLRKDYNALTHCLERVTHAIGSDDVKRQVLQNIIDAINIAQQKYRESIINPTN